MAITKENIDSLKARLDKLVEIFSIEEYYDTTELNIGDKDVFIGFPDEFEGIEYTIEEFIRYTEDIESIKKVNNSTVRSSKISQTIISVDEFIFDIKDIKNNIIENDILTLRIITKPFLIGLLASKNQIYNEDYGIFPCSSYTAIEIVYRNSSDMLEIQEEENLINGYLFYLSNKYNTPIVISEFEQLDFEEFEEYCSNRDEPSKITNIPVESLINHSSLMDMFIDAMSIGDEEIKFLYYYKIIEHCSPVVSKIRAYEMLNRKLDMLPHSKRDYKYLNSIFDLTREHDKSLRDGELAHSVLSECIDIVQLYEFLPDSIKKILSKKIQYNNKEINYDLNEGKQNQIKKEVSNILYATRNKIVHAKSNYTLNGDECHANDLPELNLFISKLCYCLVVWNDRQQDIHRL